MLLLGLLCLLWVVAPAPAQDDGNGENGPEAKDRAEAQRDGDRRDGDRAADRDDEHHEKKGKGRRDRKGPRFGGITADELDGEDIREVLEVLEEANPQMAHRLEDLREQDEAEFRQAVAEVASSRRIRWLMMQKRFDPKGFKLRANEFRLQHRMDHVKDRLGAAEPNSEEAERLKGDLRALLSEAFEVRQKLREHELERLERRIDHLRSELEEKRRRKEKLLDRRFEEILHDPDDGRHGFRKRRGKGRPGRPDKEEHRRDRDGGRKDRDGD